MMGVFDNFVSLTVLGIGLLFAVMLFFVITAIKNRNAQKRLLDGWDLQGSFIIPMEKAGVPASLTQEFLKLFKGNEIHPFIPEESLYDATLWEEQHIERAFIQIARACHRKVPESQKSLTAIGCRVVSVSDFLKALAKLPLLADK